MHLLHFTDCHAQLLPTYFREPSVNLGVGDAAGQPPHLVGEALLKQFRHRSRARATRTRSRSLDFVRGRARLRHAGRLRASRDAGQAAQRAIAPDALLLDGGDTWQGSATALWTRGQDMVDAGQAARRRRDDRRTGNSPTAPSASRELVDDDFAGSHRFRRAEREDGGLRRPGVPAVRDARDRTACRSRSSARRFPTRRSRIRATSCPTGPSASSEQELQKVVDEVRGKGAQVVVLLSHNGMDVDLKLASRVTGIDAILGGHTHDGVPQPSIVAERAAADARHQRRLRTASSSRVLDFDVQRRPGARLSLPAAAGVRESAARGRDDGAR